MQVFSPLYTCSPCVRNALICDYVLLYPRKMNPLSFHSASFISSLSRHQIQSISLSSEYTSAALFFYAPLPVNISSRSISLILYSQDFAESRNRCRVPKEHEPDNAREVCDGNDGGSGAGKIALVLRDCRKDEIKGRTPRLFHVQCSHASRRR